MSCPREIGLFTPTFLLMFATVWDNVNQNDLLGKRVINTIISGGSGPGDTWNDVRISYWEEGHQG